MQQVIHLLQEIVGKIGQQHTPDVHQFCMNLQALVGNICEVNDDGQKLMPLFSFANYEVVVKFQFSSKEQQQMIEERESAIFMIGLVFAKMFLTGI